MKKKNTQKTRVETEVDTSEDEHGDRFSMRGGGGDTKRGAPPALTAEGTAGTAATAAAALACHKSQPRGNGTSKIEQGKITTNSVLILKNKSHAQYE